MQIVDHERQPSEEWRTGVLTRMRISAVTGAVQLCLFEQWCEAFFRPVFPELPLSLAPAKLAGHNRPMTLPGEIELPTLTRWRRQHPTPDHHFLVYRNAGTRTFRQIEKAIDHALTFEDSVVYVCSKAGHSCLIPRREWAPSPVSARAETANGNRPAGSINGKARSGGSTNGNGRPGGPT
jgi:hypothetical protein